MLVAVAHKLVDRATWSPSFKPMCGMYVRCVQFG